MKDVLIFPTALKSGNIMPTFKNSSKNLKEHYRPVSILSNVSKLSESCLFGQMSS